HRADAAASLGRNRRAACRAHPRLYRQPSKTRARRYRGSEGSIGFRSGHAGFRPRLHRRRVGQMKLDRLVNHYRVANPEQFRLADFDPGDRGGAGLDKKSARDLLARDIERLSDLQERLYAQDRWAVLVVFQAMDAAGKDSAIKHVMSGVNPQG